MREREKEGGKESYLSTVKRLQLEVEQRRCGIILDGGFDLTEFKESPADLTTPTLREGSSPLDHFRPVRTVVRPQRRADQRAPGGPEGVCACVCACRCNVCVCGRKSQTMSIILKPRSRSTSSLKNTEGIW